MIDWDKKERDTIAMILDDRCPDECICARRRPAIDWRIERICSYILKRRNVDAAQAELDEVLREELTPLMVCRAMKGFDPEFAERFGIEVEP